MLFIASILLQFISGFFWLVDFVLISKYIYLPIGQNRHIKTFHLPVVSNYPRCLFFLGQTLIFFFTRIMSAN